MIVQLVLHLTLRRLTASRFFFFNDTATTEIYTLSLHDALPIWLGGQTRRSGAGARCRRNMEGPHRQRQPDGQQPDQSGSRSEEHTSELQSLAYLVCRLLLEKKKKKYVTVNACHTRLHRTLASSP